MRNIDCGAASRIIMKYMDGTTDENELDLLREHVKNCPGCDNDFSLYGKIMTDFSENAQEEAPEGFEAAVMAKIAALPFKYESAESRVETFMCWVFGVFSTLTGIGVLLFVNKSALLGYISGDERLSVVMDILLPVSTLASRVSNDVSAFVSVAIGTITPYFYSARFLMLGMALALGLTQYILYKKGKKGKVEA